MMQAGPPADFQAGDLAQPPAGFQAGDLVNQRSKIAGWLFAAFVGLYLLGLGGHIYTPDGVVVFQVTKSMVDQRRLAIEGLRTWPGFGGERVIGAEGQSEFYSKFGLGLSIFAIPFYTVGKVLAPFLGRDERAVLYRDFLFYEADPPNYQLAFEAFTTSWSNSFVVALIVVVLFLLGMELGFSLKPALLLAVIAGLATPLWHYSKAFYAEPLGALGLLSCLLFARRGSRGKAMVRHWTLAGLMLGVAIMAKIFHVLLLLPAMLLLFGYARRLADKRALWGVLGFMGGVGVALLLIFGYNLVRFGSIFETGYGVEAGQWSTPWYEGMAGLLISPSRGLLVFVPLIFLSLLASRQFYRDHRLEFLFILGCLLVLLIGYSRWHMWEGGWCWGPRFLLPVVPLLLLPILSLLERFPRRFAPRLGLGAFVLASCWVSLNGVVINCFDYYIWLKEHFIFHRYFFELEGASNYYDLVRWNFRYSPLWIYEPISLRYYFLLYKAAQSPGLILALFGGFFALFAVGTAQLTRACLRPSGVPGVRV